MTITIYDRNGNYSTLYNVDSISDGLEPKSIRVKMQFTDNTKEFQNVESVFCLPSGE